MGSRLLSWWGLRCCAVPLLLPNKSCGAPLLRLCGPGLCGTTMLSGAYLNTPIRNNLQCCVSDKAVQKDCALNVKNNHGRQGAW